MSSAKWHPFVSASMSYLKCVSNGVIDTSTSVEAMVSQIAKFMAPTWGPPGSCRPHVGPMNLAIWVGTHQLVAIGPFLNQCFLRCMAPYAITRPQRVKAKISPIINAAVTQTSDKHDCINSLKLSDAYMCQWTMATVVKIMVCHLFSPMPLWPNIDWTSGRQISLKFWSKCNNFHMQKSFWKCCQLVVILSWPQQKNNSNAGKWNHNTIYLSYESLQCYHYNDVIMGLMASQINSLMIVYSSVYSGTDQRKHQSSTSLAFVWGTHRWPVNSPHKGPVTWKMFPFDDVIM